MEGFYYKFTKPNKLIASFDLDNTLIKTKSGKIFPINSNDYTYSFDNVDKKIKNLIKDGYKIVIFTNQNGIQRGKTKLTDITNKIEKLFPTADYFISIKDDLYRKPMIGMYDKFIELNGKVNKMFYVGDASGRDNDHSYSDINFAYNAGITFYTETEYFLGKKDNVKHYCPTYNGNTNNISDLKKYDRNTIIIMQGYPASGKSTLIHDYINYYKIQDENYLHLSNDTHTKSKIKKEFKNGIEKNKLIFIDNLNATKKNRKDIFDLLNINNNYKVIGIHILTRMEISKALNKQRYYISNMKENYKGKIYGKIPNVAYNVFNKKYEKMTIDEGFYKLYEYTPDIKLKYCFI